MLSSEHPDAVLLQETMLGEPPMKPPSGYCLYTDFNNPTPGSGLAALFRNDVPHTFVQLQTPLQASAF